MNHKGESPVIWAIVSSICTLAISAFIFPEKIVIKGIGHLGDIIVNAVVSVLTGLFVAWIGYKYSRVKRLVDLAVNSVNSIKVGVKVEYNNKTYTMSLDSWMQCNWNLSQIQKRFEESGQSQLSQAVAEMKVRCNSAWEEHSKSDVRNKYLNPAVDLIVSRKVKVSWISLLFKPSPLTTGIPSSGYD